jgi:PGF-CTERM protein
MTGKPITRGVLLAALVVLAAVTGTAMGAWNGQVMVDDNSPGAEDVTYTFVATVGDDFAGHTLHNDSIVINFQYADLRTDDISAADVDLVAIDRRGDFAGGNFNILLTPIVESVTSTNTERSVAIRLNASVDDTPQNAGVLASDTEIMENDEVVVQISNMTNPDAGEYPINIDLSQKQSGGQVTGMLNVEGEQMTETEDPRLHTHTSVEETTSGDDGPGFTVAIAALALLAAALIAVRRS